MRATHSTHLTARAPLANVADRWVRPRTAASMRAACDALRASPHRVSSVSINGRVTDGEQSTLPVALLAHRLADEYGFALDIHADAGAYQMRFTRRDSTAEGDG